MSQLSEENRRDEARRFVTACYRTLLGREPDEAGLNHHVECFLATGDYQAVLESICGSTESKTRQLALSAREEIPAEVYYFFHIPKTAGLTVKAYLAQALDPIGLKLFPGVFITDLLNQIEVIRRYAFFSGHFLGFLDSLIGSTTQKATLLRDPVERAVSYYFHALRDPTLPLHNRIVGRRMDEIPSDESTRGFAVNFQAKYLAALVDDSSWLEHTLHFRSCPKSDTELLEKARAGLALIDVVGVHEDLAAFFDLLSKRWPIRSSSAIPKVNVGKNRDARLVSAADRQLLREANTVDCRLYEEVVDRLRELH